MTEKFSFFDPVLQDGLPDREYNAQEFTDYFGDLVTTGVMKGKDGELKVTANGSNMLVEIDTGVAFVEDKRYANTAKLPHTLDTETLGKDRIDRIVIRKDLNTDARYVKSFVKKGVASASPVPPALTRNTTVYEISLAQVKVIGGQTYISAGNVTDERGKEDVCPWAGSKILPNFDDAALQDLMDSQLTNGHITKDYSSGHLNDLTNTGYYTSIGATLGRGFPLNSPTSQMFIEVFRDNSDFIYQRIAYLTGSTQALFYYRILRNGIWGVWQAMPSGVVTSLEGADGYSNSLVPSAYVVKQVNDKLIGNTVAMGKNSVSTGSSTIAIGEGSSSKGYYSMSIGYNAESDNFYGIAIGHSSKAPGEGSLAVGRLASSTGRFSIALGPFSNVVNEKEAVLGTKASENGANRWLIPGSFSVSGGKNFEIPHPRPGKKDTHVIRHGAVESPTAGDTLYRYTIEASTDGETVEMQLPDYFEYLNKDVDVWVNGDGHFGRAYGKVEGDTLYVTCELVGSYKVLVIGTRNDDHESVQTWDIKGVEREIGESWTGETYSYEVDEIVEIQEITQGVA